MKLNRIFLSAVGLLSFCLLIASCAGAPKSDEELLGELADKYLSAVKEGDVYKAQKYMAPEEAETVTYAPGMYISDVTRLYTRWEYEIGKITIEDDFATINYYLVTKGKISLSNTSDEKMLYYPLYAIKLDGKWKITQQVKVTSPG